MKLCFEPKFLVALCLLLLSSWGAAAQDGPVTAQRAQRKEVLRYMHSVSLLTNRVFYVQGTESEMLLHEYRWPDQTRMKKMRLEVAYMHVLVQAAKSLNVPEPCRPANQTLVTSLTALEHTFYDFNTEYHLSYHLNTKEIADMNLTGQQPTKIKFLMNKAGREGNKSKDYQYRFLKAIGDIAIRFRVPDTDYYRVEDWPTTSW